MTDVEGDRKRGNSSDGMDSQCVFVYRITSHGESEPHHAETEQKHEWDRPLPSPWIVHLPPGRGGAARSSLLTSFFCWGPTNSMCRWGGRDTTNRIGFQNGTTAIRLLLRYVVENGVHALHRSLQHTTRQQTVKGILLIDEILHLLPNRPQRPLCPLLADSLLVEL